MLAGYVLDSARRLLADAGKARWTDPALLRWLNSGQRQIAAAVPSASSKRSTITLVGGIEQRIPVDDGIRLLSVLHNINSDDTIGRVTTLVTRSEMNDIRVSWPSSDPGEEIKHYVFDDDEPKVFEVWPPADVGLKLRIAYSALPVECADLAATLGIDPIYEGALTDFVCFRAFMEDSDDAADNTRAANHLAAFQQAVGIKAETDKTAVPKRK